MKFTTTLRAASSAISLRQKDEITERIRELAYPAAFKVEGDDAIWTVEFEGESLSEIMDRYTETTEAIRCEIYPGDHSWSADPDDPIEYAQRVARDVIEWERHFDEVRLPDELREALKVVAA